MTNATSPDLAVALLEQGGLGLLPVDTVPGLACRADHPQALLALLALKGRPTGKPLALAFRDLDQVLAWLPAAAGEVAFLARFLPGPVTLILPGSDALGALHPSWAESVGVRIPGECPCSPLLASLPWPLALSSANLSGQPTLRHTAELAPELAQGLSFRWPGESPLSCESTVLDLRHRPVRVLREGAIPGERLLRLAEDAA